MPRIVFNGTDLDFLFDHWIWLFRGFSSYAKPKSPSVIGEGRISRMGCKEMKKKIIGAAVAAAAMFGTISAQAASLSIIPSGATVVLSGFDLAISGLGNGSTVQLFTNGSSGGLILSGAPTDVTFEYLGSETGALNRAVENENGDELFRNYDPDGAFLPGTASSIGDTAVVNIASGGYVPFKFDAAHQIPSPPVCALGLCLPNPPTYVVETATNGGDIEGLLAIALFQESSTSVIALLNDGTGIYDYDDFALRISVTAIPLPPAVLLFGGALIGLGWLTRRRKLAA